MKIKKKFHTHIMNEQNHLSDCLNQFNSMYVTWTWLDISVKVQTLSFNLLNSCFLTNKILAKHLLSPRDVWTQHTSILGTCWIIHHSSVFRIQCKRYTQHKLRVKSKMSVRLCTAKANSELFKTRWKNIPKEEIQNCKAIHSFEKTINSLFTI